MAITRRGQMVRDDSNFPVGFNFYLMPAAATTGNIANNPGILHALVIGTPKAGSLILYDGTSASGTTLANITTYVTMGNISFDIDVNFSTGLFISATAGMYPTVSYISADK